MKFDIDLTEQDIKNIIAESLSLNNKDLVIKPEDVKLCSCDIGINRIYSANVRFEEKKLIVNLIVDVNV